MKVAVGRLGIVLGAMWLALALCTAAVGQVISVPNVSAAPGETANVDVTLDANVRGVASAQFVLDFSRASSIRAPALTPVLTDGTEAKVILGQMVPTGALVSASAKTQGRVTVGIAGVTGFSGPGTMVTVPLHIPSDAPAGATYQLLLRDVLLYSEDGRQIQVTARSGTLTVAGLLEGDPNGDGVIDIRDAMLALRIAVGLVPATQEQLAAADVSKDRRVTVLDAQFILRMALGLLPIPTTPEASRRAITESYQRLADAIEAKDIDAVMSFVSRDYLHDGVNYDGFRAVFVRYFATHRDIQVTFTVRAIDLDTVDSTQLAYVTFDQVISSRRISDLQLEEERNLDSYMVWILEGTAWRMVGNQQEAGTMSTRGPGVGSLLGGRR